MGSFIQPTLRIASVSGSVTDRRHGFAELARDEEVQFIVGDYMSEYNMTMRGGSKVQNPLDAAYEPCFLESIIPALPHLAQKNIRVAVNAGGSDTRRLYEDLMRIIQAQELDLKVAYVEGDEVFDAVEKAIEQGDGLRNLTTGQHISDWKYKPMYAQCYLGCFGIVEALKHGADIVLCGRVADASPTMACCAYYYGWDRQDYQQLAQAFVAGHFIECSTYVTGGNFSGFKQLQEAYTDIGYPVIEVESNGDFVVTKQKGKNGLVSAETCKAQLLYEIQGPLYYNSDVVAQLQDIRIENVGKDRVLVTNVGYLRPPPTTKVGITAHGGYQAEVHYFLCGLDIAEKAAMIETQVRALLDETKYHTLVFRTTGTCPEDPSNQDAATVDLRIFAQSAEKSALSLQNFLRPCTDTIMQSYPGATFATDARQAEPKPYYEVIVPDKGTTIDIPPPTDTTDFLYQQSSYETSNPVSLTAFGPTTKAPLGYVAHARSGDKGSDANVGFFVRNQDEWDWLRSLLTIDRVKDMLGSDFAGGDIYRFELPSIWAVHFLLKDHLDRGVSSTSSYDALGKNVAEYLRCRRVLIPEKFLARGRI